MPLKPKVSVAMITYNHAAFIAQALDSVLAQHTDFDFEIVIGDDASSDGTRKIIEEYQARWPKIIKPVFHQPNVGMMKNFRQTLERCSGDYIAILEGDDYWTNQNKLTLQVDYL